MKISIIIPALNEEAAIGAAIDQIPLKELKNLGIDAEVLVVDNASTDRTSEIAKAHGARVIYQPIRGYGNAYKAGFLNATGDIIATGDADMTYPFDALPSIVTNMLETGDDFVNTDRLSKLNPEAMTLSHVFGNWMLSMVTQVLFGWPFNDSQSGMWIFKRNILEQMDVQSSGMPFSQELKIEAYIRGFKCSEVPIEYRVRVGEVKLNTFKDGFGNIAQLFRKRFTYWKQASKTNTFATQSSYPHGSRE